LNHVAQLLTYWVGNGNPLIFRLRNLGFHVINAMLVYALGWLLFKSKRVSAVGAALFALHPVSNQATIGAVWPNTMAYAGFLLALVMFIGTLEYRRGLFWLIGSLVIGSLSLLMYEGVVGAFFLMGLYLAGRWLIHPHQGVKQRFVLIFAGLVVLLFLMYFFLRSIVVPRGWHETSANLPSASLMMKNASMYLVALLSPIDSVLSNELLHTPLPSEVALTPTAVALLGSLAIVVVGLLSLLLWWNRRGRRDISWIPIGFLLSGVLVSLLPVLMFVSHPSETYLYPAAAFYGLLLSHIVTEVAGRVGRDRLVVYVLPVFGLLVLFAAATWVRNERVSECGRTAQRILNQLPTALRTGQWNVSFANVPGELATRRYGFYGFRGIDTIGHGSLANRAVSSALQLVFRNELLRGHVVEPAEVVENCRAGAYSGHLCIWVHWDGRIELANWSGLTSPRR
jgi:hypothetical protein